MLASARRVLVITGAGISVASGLPVYRGVAGSRYEDPETLRESFASSLRKDPEGWWRRHGARRALLAAADPNPAHEALVQLERRCEAFLLVTQNVDDLHRRAGSQALLEVHGNAFTLRCLNDSCEVPSRRDETDPSALEGCPAPRCERCDSLMRADVVLFGEGSPKRWGLLQDQLPSELELVLLIGSSATVETPQDILELLAERGERPPVLVINPAPEPLAGLPSGQLFGLAGRAEEALPALLEGLTEPV